MSDSGIIRQIRRNFVPVALNLYEIREAKGPAGDFFRAVKKQAPELYQGLYLVTPEGKLLAAHGKMEDSVEKWTTAVRATLDQALKITGPLPARPDAGGDPPGLRGKGFDPDGGSIWAVYTRPMVLGLDRRGLGDHAIDSIHFTAADWKAMAPPRDAGVGTRWSLPQTTARKLHKALSPNSDANTLARPDEVTDATFTFRITRLRDGLATVRIDGHLAGIHTWQFEPNKGKKIRAAVGFLGVGQVEVRSGRWRTLTLVGEGLYSHFPPYEEPSKYGAVIEWHCN
ncbi:MAG: hypothetical protein SNJ75_08115 [Gemmataceae bacterium]